MRKPSPAMIVALVALFFALASTGIAASHYLITNTSQIKPSVLRQLRGHEGPQGAQGLQGPPGSPGAPGRPGSEANLSNLCSGIKFALLELGQGEDVHKALETIRFWAC